MLIKRKARSRPMSDINVVPYIDVMLVLLVIFMITAPILTQGITVSLPQAQGQVVEQGSKEPIIVSVNAQGELFLNVSETPDLPLSPDALVVRVAAELALAKEQNEKQTVLVKGDQGAMYGHIARAMGLLKQAGAVEVGLMTDPTSDVRTV